MSKTRGRYEEHTVLVNDQYSQDRQNFQNKIRCLGQAGPKLLVVGTAVI